MYIPACLSQLCPTFVATVANSEPNTKKQTERTDEGESKILSRRGGAGTKGWPELNSGFTQRAARPSNA